MSLERVIARDTKIRRASLRGNGNELVKLGIPREHVNKYHYMALEYYCKKPELLVTDSIDPYKDLTVYQLEVLSDVMPLDTYIIVVECERMGSLK